MYIQWAVDVLGVYTSVSSRNAYDGRVNTLEAIEHRTTPTIPANVASL